MPLTQAQSLENLLTEGFPISSSFQQLYLNDGLGDGTFGATATCNPSVLTYITRHFTMTCSVDIHLDGTVFTVSAMCGGGTVTIADGMGLNWGPFGFTAGGPFVGLNCASLGSVYAGGNGSFTASVDMIEQKTLGDPLTYSLAIDPAGSWSFSYSLGPFTGSGSNTNTHPPGTGFPAWPWNLEVFYLGTYVDNTGVTDTPNATSGGFSLSSISINGTPDCTCHASATWAAGADPSIGIPNTAYQASATGTLGTFSYSSLASTPTYGSGLGFTPAQAVHMPFNLFVGAPVTLTKTTQALDAFGSASSHAPLTACSWAYTGIDLNHNFLFGTVPLAWGTWPTTVNYLDFEFAGIDILTYVGYDLASDRQVDDPPTPEHAFQRKLLKYARPPNGLFKVGLDPGWMNLHNWWPLDRVQHLDDVTFNVTTLALANSLVVDSFPDGSGWSVAQGAGSVGAGPGLNLTATANDTQFHKTGYQIISRHFRFMDITVKGTAADAWIQVVGNSGIFCLPALTSTPQTFSIDLTQPTNSNGGFVDATQVGGNGGLAWGEDTISELVFGGLQSGDTLTCTNITLYHNITTFKGGLFANDGPVSPHIYSFADGKTCGFGPRIDQYALCLNAWVQAINDATARSGLSASAVGMGTPSTTYNGDLPADFLDFLPVDTDLSSIPIKWLFRSAAGFGFYAGMQNAPLTVRIFLEHFVHGLSSLLGATTASTHVRVTGGEGADEYLVPNATTFYYRSGTRFPPRVEKCIQGPDSVTITGTGPAVTVDSAQVEPGWVWAGFGEVFACPKPKPHQTAVINVNLLRDYTDRLHIYGATGTGDLEVAIYKDDDTSPSTVTIDSGACMAPNFWRSGEVLIEGTYLNGRTPRLARSRTHGNTWYLMSIPGSYDNLVSAFNHQRLIVLAFKAANAMIGQNAAWYVRVGVRQDDGTYSWSDEVNLNLANPSGSGDLKERPDSVMEFTWTDTSGATQLLRGRLIPNDAGDGSEWTPN